MVCGRVCGRVGGLVGVCIGGLIEQGPLPPTSDAIIIGPITDALPPIACGSQGAIWTSLDPLDPI
jgi:hypothetical protein